MLWLGIIQAALLLGGSVVPNKANGSWRGNLGSIAKPTMIIWLIDGNNLSCSRGVPNERETILRELAKVASPRSSISIGRDNNDHETKNRSEHLKHPMPSKPISNVVVVFDGNEDEASNRTIVDKDNCLEWTITDGRNRVKDRADDWIVDKTVPTLRRLIDERIVDGKGSTRVNLVSADRELQKRVKAACILNGGSFVHPPKFWRDYIPVLQEQQQSEEQQKRRKKS